MYLLCKMQEELRSKNSQKKLIPVVGAGVSFATAGLPNWPNLIENGVKYIEDRNFGKKADLDRIRKLLDRFRLPEAAKKLKLTLDKRYRAWLEYEFGNPKIQSVELRDSIINLGAPFILTTNFDSLLNSSIRYRNVYSWNDVEMVRLAREKNETFIFHLHGSYKKPETAIFGDDDYKAIVEDIGYRSILNSIFLQNSLMFIGCSKDGILDDDFSAAIEYFTEALPDSAHQHYILMRTKESTVEDTRKFLLKYNIQIVRFGDNHDELPSFINKLNNNLEYALKFSEKEKHFSEELETYIKGGTIENDVKNDAAFIGNDSKLIRELFDIRQKQSTNKRKEFESQQKLIRRGIDEQKLHSLISSFAEYSWRVDDDPKEIIDMALKLNNLLEIMPQDTLRRIKRFFNRSIDESWFTGHLKFYVRLYYSYKDKGEESSFNDSYQIKNLWLILKCYQGVIDADPKVVFPELNPKSQVLMNYVSNGIVLTTHNEISIRDVSCAENILAFIAAEEGMKFGYAQLVYFRGQQFVVGFNKQFAFHWDPYNGNFVVPFFDAESDADIEYLRCFSNEDGELLIYILIHRTLYVYKEFVFVKSLRLQVDIGKSTWLKNGNFLASPSGTYGEIELMCIENNQSVRYSAEELWVKVLNQPILREAINSKLDNWVLNGSKGIIELKRPTALADPFFKSVEIDKKEYLAMVSVFYDSLAGAINVVLFWEFQGSELSIAGFYLNEIGVVVDMEVIDSETPYLVLVKHGVRNENMNYFNSLEFINLGNCFTFLENHGNLSYPDHKLDLIKSHANQKTESIITYDFDKNVYIFTPNNGQLKRIGPLSEHIQSISVFNKL